MIDNRLLFKQLSANPEYTDVELHPVSSGVKATHLLHSFHPRNGFYEREVQDIPFTNGDAIILGKEREQKGVPMIDGIKHEDGLYNGRKCEIATIVGTGKDGVKRALKHCASKGAQVAILYFPEAHTYTEDRWSRGIGKFGGIAIHRFLEIVVIHGGMVHKKSHL